MNVKTVTHLCENTSDGNHVFIFKPNTKTHTLNTTSQQSTSVILSEIDLGNVCMNKLVIGNCLAVSHIYMWL
jgi:hypothetical protein